MKQKRIWQSLICAVLLTAALAVPSEAVGNLTVSIGSVTAVAGGEVSVPITVQNNPGIAMTDLKIVYDTAALTFEAVENGIIFAPTDLADSYSAASPYPILFVSTSGNRTEDGTLIILRFRVKEGCANGDYPLTIQTGSIISDFNETVLDTRFEAGEIRVGSAQSAQIISVNKISSGVSTVIVCPDANATVICAAYDSSGKMIGTESKPASVGQKTYQFSLTSYNSIKVFLLGSPYKPICESVSR